MTALRPFLLGLPAGPPAAFAPALRALGGQLVLALPQTAIVLAPEEARDALARLPGVQHVGGVNLPERRPPRLRYDLEGRPMPVP